jgi:hypothetical protein
MTGTPASGVVAREALTRRTSAAVAVLVLAGLALLPADAVVAQERSRSPAPEKLWKAYPLDPTAAPSAQPDATTSPAALAGADRRPLGATRANGDGGVPVIVFALLVLLMGGGAVTFLETRRRRGREHEPQAAEAPPRLTPVRPARSPSAGRFARVAARTSGSRANAVVAAAHDRGGGSTRAGSEPPKPAAAPSAAPSADAAPAASPPDRRIAWTAEIEWRHTSGESRFCVIARGPRTVTLAQSRPLEWPPTGPAAVQAMTDAAEALAATLAAAGWTPLPPGHSWYAKRFAWEPAAADARSAPGAPHRMRRRRLALVCVLIVLGTLAALQLTGGDDDSRVAKPAPSTGKPGASHGTDLSLPLLVLLGLVPVVLVIRETRRGRR